MDIGAILTILWPYLTVLYILDCFLIVRGGHLLLAGSAFSGFKAREPGLRLTGLLPWDWSILSIREPLLLSEKGVYSRIVPFPEELRPPGPVDLELITWEEIGKVGRDGRKVLIDGRVIHTAPSGVAARRLAGNMKTIRDKPESDRRKAVEAVMIEATDTQVIRVAVDGIKKRSSTLIYSSTLFLILVFVLIPVSLIARVPLFLLKIEAVFFGVVYLLVVTFWWRAHKALLPEEAGDRLEELMMFVFLPVSAMHAFGKLTRRLFTSFEGVALTVVLDPGRAEDVLKREYIRTLASAGFGGGDDLAAVWEMRARLLEKLAAEAGVDLACPVARSDALNREKICPLCAATYREGIMECADCRVSLRAIEVLKETMGEDGNRKY